MALPIMTQEQCTEALRKAGAARAARAAALAPLKAGTVTLAEVVADKDSPLQRAFVRQVLLALPGVGPVRAQQVMEQFGIAENRRVRGLGKNQRAALAEMFTSANG